MPQPQAVPASLASLTDLALDITGSLALHATDEFFAAKENLTKPEPPEWREGVYTERGKWMDGWESARRRTPGHDAVIVRLGTPGVIHAVVVDTTHFKGNAPEAVSLESLDVPAVTPVDDLLALPVAADAAAATALGGRAWVEVVPRTAVKPDHPNVLTVAAPAGRASHVRLRIHPDGGVARLRVLGHVVPDVSIFHTAGALDLTAIEHGGRVVQASDAFFAPASNLLLPGRGHVMGTGWETARRRTPGSDWCVIQLGRRGVVEHFVIDTWLFKGNAPLALRIEGADVGEGGAAPAADAWKPLVGRTPLGPHLRHAIGVPMPRPLTHLRVHMIPHGGIHRLRAFGHALDTPGERRALAALQALDPAARREALLACCGSSAFAERLAARLPVASIRSLFAAADEVFAALSEKDLLEAFAAHPALGASPTAADRGRSAEWSRGEQSALGAAVDAVRDRLAAANRDYAARHGFTFILCASGRPSSEVLAALEERLGNDRASEIANAAREQAAIMRLRIEKWLDAHGAVDVAASRA